MSEKCKCGKKAQYWLRFVHAEDEPIYVCGDCIPEEITVMVRKLEYCPHCHKRVKGRCTSPTPEKGDE